MTIDDFARPTGSVLMCRRSSFANFITCFSEGCTYSLCTFLGTRKKPTPAARPTQTHGYRRTYVFQSVISRVEMTTSRTS